MLSLFLPSKPRGRQIRDLTKEPPFGRWTVIKYAGRQYVGRQLKTFWVCRCSCGTEKQITAQQLVSSNSRSCGCLASETTSLLRTTHGRSNTPEYRAWLRMRRRCEKSTSHDWTNYGGRGIRVCRCWTGSKGFVRFLRDMGERPGPRYSVERRDNAGHYAPTNCVWATNAEQSRNRRTTRLFTWHGKTLCIKDWSVQYGIAYDKLRKRLVYRGWTFHRAISTP